WGRESAQLGVRDFALPRYAGQVIVSGLHLSDGGVTPFGRPAIDKIGCPPEGECSQQGGQT
uniref:hypothetical protein n=1 Tax=Mycobacterium sp. HUMS_1102779 TaxID=3383487 RepID=UPI00389AC63D